MDEDVQSGRGRASGTSGSDGVCTVGNNLEMKAGEETYRRNARNETGGGIKSQTSRQGRVYSVLSDITRAESGVGVLDSAVDGSKNVGVDEEGGTATTIDHLGGIESCGGNAEGSSRVLDLQLGSSSTVLHVENLDKVLTYK